MDSAGAAPPESQPANKYPKVEYNSLCHDSDGRNFCSCQWTLRPDGIDKCMYYGRKTEPLAFSLAADSVTTQDQFYLLTILPKEIRDMIYEYAFTDNTSHPPNRNNIMREYRGRRNKPRASDIAFPFLQTCKMVYLEAYRLPLMLNPLLVYDFQVPTRPRLHKLAPWQFALIQGIDISLQQNSLEHGELADYMKKWKAQDRHKAAYVAPRFYSGFNKIHGLRKEDLVQILNFGLLGADDTGSVDPKDGDEVTLANNPFGFYDHTQPSLAFDPTARAMVARPLTRLTLRLTRMDWWTWSNNPDASSATQHLRLDPSMAQDPGAFPIAPIAGQPTMHELAEQRRAGRHPPYDKNWGAIVCSLPDLKIFELVLETWEVKKKQLDTVVECAQTWKFPLAVKRAELVWDKTEVANWKREEGGEEDFVEKQVPTYACHNGPEVDTEPPDSDEEEELYSSDEEELYGSDEDRLYESDEDRELNQEEDSDEIHSAREERWDKKCREFEVRIVRFKRRPVA